MPKPLNPEATLLKLRDKLGPDGPIRLGHDGLPVHWRVKEYADGYQFCDSSDLLKSVGYSAINMQIRRTRTDGLTAEGDIPPEHLTILFRRFLDWLALNLPQSKDWGVEFTQGCPPISCDRVHVSPDAKPMD